MRRRNMRLAVSAAVAVTALAGLSAVPSGGLMAQAATRHLADLTSSAPVTVVASGLNQPRNLTWGPDHHLLVSEAGTVPTVCAGTQCFGLNGSISDISSGRPRRIVTGLATYSDKGFVVGAAGLTYIHGRLYTVVTHTPLPGIPAGIPADLSAELTRQFGAVLDLTGGKISVVANPGDVDYQWAQEHKSLAPNDFPDSNPYDLIAKPGGGFYFVDAASDTLGSVDRWGNVHVLAFIPNTPAGTDAVPTCLAQGPDGAVYIGQLTGDGNSATAANVYRYVPWNGSLTVWQSGFSAIEGCGFGANGDFYVTEFDTTGLRGSASAGAVIQISHDGTRTVLGGGKLLTPGGFLAGRDGAIYVVNNSLAIGTGAQTGEVVRIG
jgi:hypothetical protein